MNAEADNAQHVRSSLWESCYVQTLLMRNQLRSLPLGSFSPVGWCFRKLVKMRGESWHSIYSPFSWPESPAQSVIQLLNCKFGCHGTLLDM